MVLLLAVVAGLVAGLARAWIGKRSYQAISLRSLWLVICGTLPQIIAFYLPGTRDFFQAPWAAVCLVSSQIILLAFILLNLRQPGMWIVGIGLASNLLVILANGGLMPISPETVLRLYPTASPQAFQPYLRLGWSKDIILPEGSTRLAWLADRFVSPLLVNARYAFSIGDILIAAGVFWLLWTLGGTTSKT